MPPGRWRRRPPLPPSPGTVVVCPIGEATPETAERYRRERDATEQGEPDPIIRIRRGLPS